MLTWSLELLSSSLRHIQDDICNKSILSAITQIYVKNTPWENTFSICITTVVIMKPSVPKIQNLAKGRRTYQYLPLLFLLILNIQAFWKSFTEVHEKIINRFTTGHLKRDMQLAILHLSNEGTEGLGLLKGPFNSSCPSKWHRVGSVSWVLVLSCHTLQTDPSPKAWAISPCMPSTSNNHTQTANPLQHFVLITTISHLSSNSTRTLTLPMPLKAKRAIHINLILVTLAGS